MAVHPAVLRRAHRPARAAQGRRLARRQLVREREVGGPGARGLPGLAGRLVHGGDVPHLGAAGAVSGTAVRHPAGPAAHPRARHGAGHHHGDDRRHAHRPGPVLGLGALLHAAGPPVRAGSRSPQRRGDHPSRLRPQPAPLHGLCEARRGVRTARLGCGPAAHRPGGRRAAGQGHRSAARRAGLDHRCQRHGCAGLDGPAVRRGGAPRRVDGHLVPRPEGLVPQSAAAGRPPWARGRPC